VKHPKTTIAHPPYCVSMLGAEAMYATRITPPAAPGGLRWVTGPTKFACYRAAVVRYRELVALAVVNALKGQA